MSSTTALGLAAALAGQVTTLQACHPTNTESTTAAAALAVASLASGSSTTSSKSAKAKYQWLPTRGKAQVKHKNWWWYNPY